MMGVLAVWTDVEATAEAAFGEWYNRQHIPERVAVPGFRNGQRYRSLGDGPRYFAWYETDTPAVLRSAAYTARLESPTPWTLQIMPAFRNTVRSVFSARVAVGAGRGAYLATVRPRGDQPLALTEADVAALIDQPGIVAAQWWRLADGETAPNNTAETAIRGQDGITPESILIEATEIEALDRACAAVNVAGQDALVDRYRLIYTLTHADAVQPT